MATMLKGFAAGSPDEWPRARMFRAILPLPDVPEDAVARVEFRYISLWMSMRGNRFGASTKP